MSPLLIAVLEGHENRIKDVTDLVDKVLMVRRFPPGCLSRFKDNPGEHTSYDRNASEAPSARPVARPRARARQPPAGRRGTKRGRATSSGDETRNNHASFFFFGLEGYGCKVRAGK